jgi:hypothetical protein
VRKTVVYPLLVIAFLLLSGCMPLQAPAAMQAEAAPSPTPTIIENAGDVPRISLDEAKAHFDNGTAIFVDARSKGDYDIEHIDGAVLSTLPASKLGNTIPKDQLIITYCT